MIGAMRVEQSRTSDRGGLSSESEMGRPPKKIENTDEVVKFSLLLDADLVRDLTAIGDEMRAGDPLKRIPNRADLVRGMIKMGIDAYRSRKK